MSHRLYKSIMRPLLFRMEAERAHHFISTYGRISAALGGPIIELLHRRDSKLLSCEVAGLTFPNPIGMAAGFDKQGDLYFLLRMLGFGFIESGTFTAYAQPGNPQPRLLRYPKHEAILNRMGFNNPGADAVAATISRLKRRPVPRGINLGKSKITPNDAAEPDYLASLHKLAPFGDYIVINVSSPNTPGLRELQKKSRLLKLLGAIRDALIEIRKSEARPLPLFVKIAPDLNYDELADVLWVVQTLGLDGIVISNTTINRAAIPEAASEEGGLSGRLLRARSTELISKVYQMTGGRLPIIGVGGIFDGRDALEKIEAGASLLQVYTGLIYEGPFIANSINSYLERLSLDRGVQLRELVGAAHRR